MVVPPPSEVGRKLHSLIRSLRKCRCKGVVRLLGPHDDHSDFCLNSLLENQGLLQGMLV